MNLEEFYVWFKEALSFFNLDFHQKDRVKMSFGKDSITLRYENETIILNIGEE